MTILDDAPNYPTMADAIDDDTFDDDELDTFDPDEYDDDELGFDDDDDDEPADELESEPEPVSGGADAAPMTGGADDDDGAKRLRAAMTDAANRANDDTATFTVPTGARDELVAALKAVRSGVVKASTVSGWTMDAMDRDDWNRAAIRAVLAIVENPPNVAPKSVETPEHVILAWRLRILQDAMTTLKTSVVPDTYAKTAALLNDEAFKLPENLRGRADQVVELVGRGSRRRGKGSGGKPMAPVLIAVVSALDAENPGQNHSMSDVRERAEKEYGASTRGAIYSRWDLLRKAESDPKVITGQTKTLWDAGIRAVEVGGAKYWSKVS